MSFSRCLPLILGGFVAAVVSCSSGADAPVNGGGGTSPGSGGGANAGATTGNGSGASSGTGGGFIYPDGGGTGGDTTFDPDAECAGTSEPAKLTTVNLIFIIDKSGSMGNPDSPMADQIYERWNPVTEGLLAFFEEPGTTQLNASLEFFPADGPVETACNPIMYQTPKVPLTSLDEGGTGPFIAAIDTTVPQGGTPTLPALQGSIDYAIEVALDDPAAKTVVVFVTDGEPGFLIDGAVAPGCTNNDIDHTAAVAQAAFGGNPRIPTYVIGIGPSLEALATIATAGGTQLIYVPVGNPEVTKTTFQQELASIRTLNLTCDVPIPEPPQGEQLDPAKVNVKYISADEEQMIYRSDGCPVGIGWQYSEYDDAGLPTKLELCPNTCAAVQGDETGQLQVQFGCATQIL